MGGELVARVDSGDMQPGVAYEFRAQATDKAGNARTTFNKQNGKPMRVVGPFRAITGVVDLKVNGKEQRPPEVRQEGERTGTLLTDQGGRPVASRGGDRRGVLRRLEEAASSRTVTTDAQGGFSTRLAKGPGRTIVAAYEGDRRYPGDELPPVKLSVKGKSPRRAEGRRLDEESVSGVRSPRGGEARKRGKRIEVQVRFG